MESSVASGALDAWSLHSLGNIAVPRGDLSRARSLFEESLALFKELGNPRGVATALTNVGHVAWLREEHGAARAIQEESLTFFRQVEDRRVTALVLARLGMIAHDQGDLDAARAFAEESLALREAACVSAVPGALRSRFDRCIAAAREALREAAFAAAWAQGRRMTVEQACAYALQDDEALPRSAE